MKVSIQLFMLLITVVVMGGAHFLALEFFLYWQYPWFDIPMHILGGVVAAFVLLFTPALGWRLPEKYYRLAPTLFFAFIIGVLWELFEIWSGVPLYQEGFAGDLVLDLCMDLVGGVIGYIVATNINTL